MSGLRTLLPLSAVLLIGACAEPHPIPGDELLGTFSFQATLVDGGCQGLADTNVPIIDFLGTVSRCSPDSGLPKCVGTPGRAFLTYLDADFDAGFDGQYVDVYPRARRRGFAECGDDPTRMEESIRFALLSASQQSALGAPFACPPHALDGGVPAPDGGVVAPSFGPNGFDAVQACGLMVETVVNEAYDGGGDAGTCTNPDAGAPRLPLGGCTLVYQLRGERR